ncbi:MAG: NADH-quinone oxidoreductase subunit J [Verrucomicrobiae bacterium]|nr:NADH-quinone oxidoreductase subunit J [Verrucomicrobiae bacterium]
MEFALFCLFSILTLFCAVMVVINRNPVASALCLVVSFVMLACLFALLGAFFLAVVQVLVYAGAVMVLFLFIIMLLDLKAESTRTIKPFSLVAGGLVAVLLAGILTRVTNRVGDSINLPTAMPLGFSQPQDAPAIGRLLYGTYFLPFELTALILLVSLVGVVHISRREN